MSLRQIILDTETTGLRVEDGHRVIEIGCVEMIDRKLTGNHFHQYINPEREVEAGALAVHGISNQFLRDKPVFNHVVESFMAFIADSELIIHNAPFDVSFLNNELLLTRQGFKLITDYCPVTDTLSMARKLHPGQRNSLDVLCKRYGVDNSKRDLHGALLDANLLALVYLAMTGGQGSFFDDLNENHTAANHKTSDSRFRPVEKHNVVIVKASGEEQSQHEEYLQLLKKQGKCLWLKEE